MAANTNRGLVAPITEEQIAYFDTPHFDISAYFEEFSASTLPGGVAILIFAANFWRWIRRTDCACSQADVSVVSAQEKMREDRPPDENERRRP